MTPLIASMPLIASDSNQSLTRSVTLMLNRRVTSATPRIPSFRTLQPACAWASRSPGDIDPSLGGTWSRSGPRTSATPFSHASHFGIVSASFSENWAIEAWLRGASLAKTLIERPSG